MSQQDEGNAVDTNRLVGDVATTPAPGEREPATTPEENPLDRLSPEQKRATMNFIFRAKLSVGELFIGVAVLIAWIVVFAAGTVVGTQPYRDMFGQPGKMTFGQVMTAWSVIVPCYTVTNLALLCCLAGFLGGVANRAGVGDAGGAVPATPAPHDGRTGYVAATVRGFFVYLSMLSGLLLLATEAVSTPNQSQYIRLAATMSVLCFVSGYDPAIFSKMLRRVADTAEGQGGKDKDKPAGR